MIDFSFITVGEFVRWTDPAGKTSGIYEVYEIRKSDKELVSDDIILIGNANSEARLRLLNFNRITPRRIYSLHT